LLLKITGIDGKIKETNLLEEFALLSLLLGR